MHMTRLIQFIQLVHDAENVFTTDTLPISLHYACYSIHKYTFLKMNTVKNLNVASYSVQQHIRQPLISGIIAIIIG